MMYHLRHVNQEHIHLRRHLPARGLRFHGMTYPFRHVDHGHIRLRRHWRAP